MAAATRAATMDRLVRNIVQKLRSASMASIVRLDISPSPWNSTSRKRCEWQGRARARAHTHTHTHTPKYAYRYFACHCSKTGATQAPKAPPAVKKRKKLDSTQYAKKNYIPVTKISVQELVRLGVLVPGHGVISARRKEAEVAADLTSDAKFRYKSVIYPSPTAFCKVALEKNQINGWANTLYKGAGDTVWRSLFKIRAAHVAAVKAKAQEHATTGTKLGEPSQSSQRHISHTAAKKRATHTKSEASAQDCAIYNYHHLTTRPLMSVQKKTKAAAQDLVRRPVCMI